MDSPAPSKHRKFAVLATDIVCFRIINNQLHVLLRKVQAGFFVGKWGIIGGLIKPEEAAEKAADRLLKHQAGIEGIHKEQLYTFDRIDRDPRGRVVSVAYLALAGKGVEAGEIFHTKWLPITQAKDLAYDHDEMLALAIDRLRSRIGYTNIAQYLLPSEFTLSELQNVYEAVLGKGLDRRNFRKKVLASKMLKDTKHTRKEGVMRPAALYTANSKKVAIVEVL